MVHLVQNRGYLDPFSFQKISSTFLACSYIHYRKKGGLTRTLTWEIAIYEEKESSPLFNQISFPSSRASSIISILYICFLPSPAFTLRHMTLVLQIQKNTSSIFYFFYWQKTKSNFELGSLNLIYEAQFSTILACRARYLAFTFL